MLHSLVIPHLNREANLASCLRSLVASGENCVSFGDNYEVLVVGRLEGVNPFPEEKENRITFVEAETSPPDIELYPNESPPFWKTHLLNVGIEQSRGDVITFLDADAVVGPRFLEGARFLAASNLTKLCYRVRYIGQDIPDRERLWKSAPLAFEGYGSADSDGPPDSRPVFGNSQFSIRRDMLGNLRWDERFFGRSMEDIDMNRRIAEQHGDYTAAIMLDFDHAMCHLRHSHSLGYAMDRWSDRNVRLYYGTKKIWIIVSSDWLAAKAERVLNLVKAEPRIEVAYVDGEGPWRSEVLPEDEVVNL